MARVGVVETAREDAEEMAGVGRAARARGAAAGARAGDAAPRRHASCWRTGCVLGRAAAAPEVRVLI